MMSSCLRGQEAGPALSVIPVSNLSYHSSSLVRLSELTQLQTPFLINLITICPIACTLLGMLRGAFTAQLLIAAG